jgi:YbbR domain-containing protein
VTIPIRSNTKTVPIKIVRNGKAPDGVTIESIEIDENEATVTGSEDALKKTESVRVEVDISKITDNTTLTLPVIISNGVTKVTPQTVKATVVVTKQVEKTVSDVPLEIEGISEEYSATIHDPENQKIDISINGPDSAVKGIGTKDFSVFIDLSKLEEGEYEVDIQVEGPPDVKWKLKKSSATLTIERNDA